MHNGKSRPTRGSKYSQRRNGGMGGSGGGRKSGGGRRSGNGGVNVNNAAAARSKYLEKAKEALAFGDRVAAENFFQHAEHYNRILLSMDDRKSSYSEDRAENIAEESDSMEDSDDNFGGEDGSEDDLDAILPKEISL